MKRVFGLIVLLALFALSIRWATNNTLQTYNFPSVDNLPEVDILPNPFLKPDGSPIKSQAEWEQHRRYIKAMFEHYMYGHMPPPPGNLKVEELSRESVYNGEATFKGLLFSMGPEQKVRFHAQNVDIRSV